MVITNVYKTDANDIGLMATIDGVSWGVPMEVGNTFYDEIMRQVNEEGLVIAPYVEPL
jgi:hypothetical protein